MMKVKLFYILDICSFTNNVFFLYFSALIYLHIIHTFPHPSSLKYH